MTTLGTPATSRPQQGGPANLGYLLKRSSKPAAMVMMVLSSNPQIGRATTMCITSSTTRQNMFKNGWRARLREKNAV
jgi:hypothetical protein